MQSRRVFTKNLTALFSMVAASKPLRLAHAQGTAGPINSTIDGVKLGVQSASFTFSGMGIPDIIKTMRDVGLSDIDIMSEHVENFLGAPVPLPGTGRPGPWVPRPPRSSPLPGGASRRVAGAGPLMDPLERAAIREWRLNADLEQFSLVAKRFKDAGLNLFSYNLSFDNTFTDPEIEKGFEMTKALGTKIITASSPVEVFPRLKPFAEKHDVIVALHNHTIGPMDFAKAMELSENFWVNLDVGHFFASGYDPVAYIREHHDRITNIHIKDRNKNFGESVPFGEGQTPLPEVFELVKKERYGFPCCIEYVGPAGPAIELAKCSQYCKDVIRR